MTPGDQNVNEVGQMVDPYDRTECYNPLCDEEVVWPGDVHESYCSWDCAVQARGGHADRVIQERGRLP